MSYAINEQELSILQGQKNILALELGAYRPDQVGYFELLNSFKAISEILGNALIVAEGATEFVKEEAPIIEEPTPIVKEEIPEEPYVEPTPFPTPVIEEPKPEPVKEEVKEEPVIEEPKPEPVKEEPKPVVEDREYTKAEVRAALGKARLERNIDINAVIKSIGFAQFGEVPASKYAELMRAIANA